MKKAIIFISVLWFSIGQTFGERLVVGSYNIRYDNNSDAEKGNGWRQRFPIICELIKYNEFDIFGAQEVLNGQLEDMLKGLPDYGYVGVGRDDGQTKGEYAPIFYRKGRFEVVSNGDFWLSEQTEYPNKGWDAALPRICTWAKFRDKKSGHTLWFFNLHMDHIGVKAREESSKLILKKIEAMCASEAVILTGDFNVDQNSDSYRIISQSGSVKDSYQEAQIRYELNGTFNNFDPNAKTDERIDHIFVSPQFKVEKYGVLTDTYRAEEGDEKELRSDNFPKEVSLRRVTARLPSDHFPIRVDLTMEPTPVE